MGEELKMFGFATGEVAPAIKYRTDIDKYAGSCRRLRNFDVDTTGAIVRRKGAEKFSEFALDASAGTAFFYSGTFVGEKVLILFYLVGSELFASFCRLESEDKVFISAGKISGVDTSVFCKESVRMRQYNDVLFLCGNGLPVCQMRFAGFDGTFRPSKVNVYEEREENPANSKNKIAVLVDAANGVYEWTYDEASPVTYDERRSTLVARVADSLATISLTASYVGEWVVSDDGETAVFAGSTYGPGFSISYPSCFSVEKHECRELDDHEFFVFVELKFNSALFATGCNSVKGAFTTQVFAADGTIRGTYTSKEIDIRRISYTTRTVRKAFDNQTSTAAIAPFPFTIPPVLGFVPVDGGNFSVSGDSLTYPGGEAGYDEKISFSDVSTSTIIALEDTSGENVYVDWGKFGADGSKTAGAVSDIYYASGNTTLYFYSGGGRWCGTLALQVSYDSPEVPDADCSWVDVGYITAATDGVLSPAVTFKVNHYNARVRVKLTERKAAQHLYYEEKTEGTSSAKSYEADMGCKWGLRITGERRYYFEKIGSGTDTGAEVVRLNVSPQSFSCSRYSIGAFRADSGYPLTMDIAQQRLWFFSTGSYPKYFWGSKVDDIGNFSTGSEKDDGLCFEADSGTPDFARWLKYGKGQFQFGCSQSEGNLVGKDNQYSLNPTSLALENESAWGSADADACLLGDKIFYIKAGRKIIHAQVYDSGRARYVSGEVNVLARHLFSKGKGAVKLVGLRSPETVLFALREDGSLARFVFNDEQNVGAWSTYDFAKGGLKAIDIGVLYGDASDTLVVMFEEKTASGKRLTWAGIDSLSHVFTDFGDTDYESEVITNALPLDGENSYGGRGVIGKLDLYGSADAGCAFDVSFDGGVSYRAQYAGINNTGYFSPEACCRRIAWDGGYAPEAVVGVRTKCHGEFSLLALGALIVRSDKPHPPAQGKNGALF